MARQANIEIVLSDGRKAGNTLKSLQSEANHLRNNIKKLEIGSAEWEKKTKDFQKVTGRLKNVRGQMNGVVKGTSILKNAFSMALKTMLPLFAVTKIIEYGKAILDLDKKWTKLEGTLKRVAGLQGEALEGAAVQVEALSNTFDKETDDIIKSANTMSKQMNISFEKSLNLIEKGMLAGADAGGDFLDQINEYAPQLKAAGLAAEDLVTISANATKQGIFSDKGLDTIKEGMLRIREMPKATKDALSNIGLSGDQLQQQISNGTITVFEAMQKVSAKLETLPPQSAKVGQAIADIFGGPGEDAGLKYIVSLQDINGEMDSMVDTTDDFTKKQMEQLALQKELAGVTSDLANEFSGTGSIMDNLMTRGKILFFDILLKGLRGAKAGLESTINYFIDLYNESGFVRGAFNALKLAFETGFGLIKANLKTTVDGFSALGGIIKGVFTLDFDKIKESTNKFLSSVGDNYKEFGANAAANFVDAFNSTVDQREKLKPVDLTGGILDGSSENTEKQIEKLRDRENRKAAIISAAVDLVALKSISAQDSINSAEEAAFKDSLARMKKRVQAVKKSTAEEVEIVDKGEDEKDKKRTGAAQGTLAVASNVFGGLANMYDEGSDEYVKFAKIQGQLDTFNAAIAAYKSTAEIPIVGPVLAPIAAAAAVAFGELQQSKINNVKKAEYGALLHGARHSNGGIMVNAEDGEIILNRNVGLDPAGLQMASELNAKYGGIRFMESGGPVNPLSAQNVAAQAPAVTGGSTIQASDDFKNEVLAYMAKMDRWANSLQVHNNVQDTREGLQTINTLEQDAGF